MASVLVEPTVRQSLQVRIATACGGGRYSAMKFGNLFLRLFDGGGVCPSYVVWTWKDTDLVVAIVEAGDA